MVKVDDTNVAVIETVERKQVYAKKGLTERKAQLQERIAEIDAMLALLP